MRSVEIKHCMNKLVTFLLPKKGLNNKFHLIAESWKLRLLSKPQNVPHLETQKYDTNWKQITHYKTK